MQSGTAAVERIFRGDYGRLTASANGYPGHAVGKNLYRGGRIEARAFVEKVSGGRPGRP